MKEDFNYGADALIKSEITGIMEDVISVRRHLHMHPEIGFDTKNTEKLVREQLEREEIEILPAKMGVIGRIRGKDSERFVALRADMDALCLQEKNEVSYRSQVPNKMHACGHDGHTAMLLGAAKLLNRHKDQLPADVLLIFQPAEEGPNLGGARIMLADLQEKGLAEKVSSIYGLHLMNDYPTGTVASKPGAMAASTDEFTIRITGRGGHAGQPDKSIDALSIGAKVVSAMESFMSRRINPFDPAVFSVGIFQSGSAINIIAETAKIAGTLRCQNEETREYILHNMHQIAEGICSAYGASCHIDVLHGLPPLINDERTEKRAMEIAEAAVGGEKLVEIKNPMMGAEDFAYFAKSIPAAFLWIGSGNKEKGFINLAHHPKFDFDEEAMETGIRILCALAINS
ncbi:MAG: amidohydrolase [Emergencia sp.]|nr:amidohydrolase [Emergencia sp.]